MGGVAAREGIVERTVFAAGHRLQRRSIPRGRAAAALALLALAPGPRGLALDVPLGVPALELRLDNTVRLNVGIRTDPIDPKMGENPAFTSGEHSVKQGDLTAGRLDLLSELDLTYAGRCGARVSAAGWFDLAYLDGEARRSPTLVARGVPGSYVGDDYSPYTLHRYRGPWGELLDAFAFATFEAGGVPVTVKAGRHTVYWGESLMLPGALHGVSYSQTPLDLQKGFAVPGTEAKELFRPLASVSAQAQVTPTLSLAAQLFLEWQSFLYPEGGTFLGAGDFAFNGPDGGGVVNPAAPPPPAPQTTYLENGGVSWPRDFGEWGVAARWRPAWLDGTLGLYYRRYTDKFAAMLITANPGAVGPLSPTIPSPFKYRQYYAEDVDLVGVSLARQLLGASVGAELSWRHDTPLVAQSLGWAQAPASPLAPILFPHGPPSLAGNSYQARGDTLHAVLNGVGVLSSTAAFSTASVAVELTYSRWLAVRENRDMFFGEGYGVCRDDPGLTAEGLAKTASDGCATRGHLGLSAGFTPTWFRVLPGVDLFAPLSISWTLHGNSPVAMGGNEGSGTWGAGVGADVRNFLRVDLRYADFFGRTRDNGTIVTSANGQQALLKSRGSVTLTAKATF
jgi:hypothetical protein